MTMLYTIDSLFLVVVVNCHESVRAIFLVFPQFGSFCGVHVIGSFTNSMSLIIMFRKLMLLFS